LPLSGLNTLFLSFWVSSPFDFEKQRRAKICGLSENYQ